MIVSHCQRWRDGRTVFVNGPAFDPAEFRVTAISDREAASFVGHHHYSRSMPATRQSVGLWRSGGGEGPRLTGVAVFSHPMNEHIVPAYLGLSDTRAGAELGRLVLLDDVPMPAESWFMARAFSVLRSHRPGVEAVVSYADPSTWRDASGEIVKIGHVGRSYAALSAAYRGVSKRRTQWQAPGGQVVSERGLSKIRNGECGHRYAADQLVALGASRPGEGESGAAWIDGLRSSGFLRRAPAPPKHVYAWGLTRRARSAARHLPSLAYPVVGDPTAPDVTALPLFAR